MYGTYFTEFISMNILSMQKNKYVHDSLKHFDMKMTLLMNIVCYNL